MEKTRDAETVFLIIKENDNDLKVESNYIEKQKCIIFGHIRICTG